MMQKSFHICPLPHSANNVANCYFIQNRFEQSLFLHIIRANQDGQHIGIKEGHKKAGIWTYENAVIFLQENALINYWKPVKILNIIGNADGTLN